jgi:pimeloyl-ACP methyl ester carboxylesterase
MNRDEKKTGETEIRGVRYYHEIEGEGEPLLLLHGGLGSMDMFGPNRVILGEHRRLITVDLQGHGRTTLGARPIRLTDLADDVAELLEKLGIRQADVLGYSLGGGVALRLAIQHPDRVRRLVVVSAGFAREGFHPEMLPMQEAVGAGMAEAMRESPMYRAYVGVAPHPEDFPKLLDATGDLMRQPYDWRDDVSTLKMPVMLVYGDGDMFRLEHVVEFYHLLGGGLRDAGWQRENLSPNRLAILPDLTHYEIFNAPALGHAVRPFLDGRTGTKSWAEQVEQAIRARTESRSQG